MNETLLYGFVIAMGLFVAAWVAFVVPAERRYHDRKLATVQKRLAEREEARQRALTAGAGAVVLTTARLVLRELTLDDAALLLAVLNDADFLRYVGDRGVRSEAAARDYLQRGPLDSYRRNGYGMYLAVRRSDGVAIGICGLVRRDGLDAPDVGFALLPPYRAQGFAIEAARAVLEYGLATLALPRIVAIARPDHRASIRILQECGMHLDGTVCLPGDDTELNVYAAGPPR